MRDWIARAPGWLDVRPAHPGADDVALAKLDDGERAAIALALGVKADLVLMDDREGVGIARGRQDQRRVREPMGPMGAPISPTMARQPIEGQLSVGNDYGDRCRVSASLRPLPG